MTTTMKKQFSLLLKVPNLNMSFLALRNCNDGEAGRESKTISCSPMRAGQR
jgi:hypothetical protein